MTTLQKFTAQLDALDDDFSIFFAAKPPAKARIDALEKKLGVPLHAEHRALIEKVSACAIVTDEKVWPRPLAYEVRPAWQFHWGIEVFGLASKSSSALDVVVQTRERAPSGAHELVAAMRRLGAGWCVGYDAKGTLYEWEPGSKPSKLGSKHLLGVLAGWVRVLENDKAKMKKLSAKNAGGGAGAGAWVEKLAGDGGSAAGKKLMKEPPAVRKEVIDLIAKALAKGAEPTDYLWRLAEIAADERATDALMAYARKGNTDARTTALGILGTHPGKPKRVVPVLLDALGESNEDIVANAAEALLAYADPTMIAPLAKALTKVQKNPRWVHGVAAGYIYKTLAAAALKGKASDHDRVVDVLTANLAPKASRYAALDAFEALIAMGPKAKRAVPALEKSIAQKDMYLSSLARHAHGAITGAYEPHLAPLRAAAKAKDEAVRAVAEGALEDATRRKRKRT
ncbi:MAG: HEAT repeat domain-containing protein [Labilithrix sp.]|nr:HEAT repeat domain-containing protein [Labilithrix sp.]